MSNKLRHFFKIDSTELKFKRQDFPSLPTEPVRIYYIIPCYEITKVTYPNEIIRFDVCCHSWEKIVKENSGKWFGWKCEKGNEDIDNFNAKSSYEPIFSTLENARKFAKDFLSQDVYQQSSNGFLRYIERYERLYKKTPDVFCITADNPTTKIIGELYI